MDGTDLFALNDLGYYYDTVEHNLDKAIACFRRALEYHSCDCFDPKCGVSTVKCNLACKIYERGNIEEATKYFEDAAKHNHPGANFYMAKIYEKNNNISAIKFYKNAAKYGCGEAIEWLKEKKY